MRTIIIGDIHGCDQKLHVLLAVMGREKKENDVLMRKARPAEKTVSQEKRTFLGALLCYFIILPCHLKLRWMLLHSLQSSV